MEDQIQGNTVSSELIVRDATGAFKILRKGRLEEWNTVPAGGARAVRQSAPQGPAAPSPASLSTPLPTDAYMPEKAVSRHYIDASDEEEIAALRSRGDETMAVRINRLAGTQADAMIRASGISFSDEVRPRLWRAIMSRLKDVRDLIETKEVLTRRAALGGVGLPAVQAQQVLKLIEQARADFDEAVRSGKMMEIKPLPRTPAGLGAEGKNADTPSVSLAEVKKQEDTRPPSLTTSMQPPSGALPASVPPLRTPPVKPFIHPSYRSDESGIPDKESRPSAIHDDTAQVQGSKFETPKENTFPTGQTRDSSQPRQQMQDVRAHPRVVGPVEELRMIGLEDFRRLGATAQLAADKVREKVELLADESLLRRNEGMGAWKSSPVHQLYLSIGRESMAKNVTVKNVINDWQAHARPALTTEEFDAIADLNQKLAY